MRDKYACNEVSESRSSALGIQRISLSGFELMLKEFSRINIRTCQKLKSETSLYSTSVQSYLKVPAFFEYICRVSQCKDICAKLLQRSIIQIAKYIRQTPITQVHLSTFHSREILLMGSSFPLNCFVSHLT